MAMYFGIGKAMQFAEYPDTVEGFAAAMGLKNDVANFNNGQLPDGAQGAIASALLNT